MLQGALALRSKGVLDRNSATSRKENGEVGNSEERDRKSLRAPSHCWALERGFLSRWLLTDNHGKDFDCGQGEVMRLDRGMSNFSRELAIEWN